MPSLNATHDPALKSWVPSANAADTDFPIQNLPHGVFSTGGKARGGVAIGDQILDMDAAVAAGLFSGDLQPVAEAAAKPQLNDLMARGNGAASKLRARLSEILRQGSPDQAKAEACLVPMASAQMQVPARIGGFTDFCTSLPHVSANRPGRPARPIHQAFMHLPCGYNSRASSIVVDGSPVQRPNGQGLDPVSNEIYFEPSRDFYYELELGAFVGPGNSLGQPVHLDAAPDQIWGYAVVNDWSARDIQRFESMLGPFLSKNLRTTISSWIVTQEAMAPFRIAAYERAADAPPVKPHLKSARHDKEGNLDIRMQALIRTPKMRAAGEEPAVLTDTNFKYSLWSMEQMLVHHASNGCNMQPGDLYASGTVSGPELVESACMWELTGGTVPAKLPNGEERNWVLDGDQIILRGRAQAPGAVSIGFGDCGAEIVPAPAWPSAPAA